MWMIVCSQCHHRFTRVIGRLSVLWSSAMSINDLAKTKEAYNRMEKQGELFHHLCNTIYLNPKSSVGQKWELKCAEWELYDFLFWGNEWNNSAETVTSWFDQWCYDINYDILSA